ncbi:hypothetical protein SODALDRAFT_356871 [Sodiomyces alkalinus F11]|uniref:Uncharacterized protein n=1 Tax=Sodiomyces alkalinus (strain CBS 110278 / VKM F-3762 / F11) TaxID=1314773 RepID=A0A3N2Q299_SODAK|nr:hypothetical protein SODALDRAFT_356871 [Sodiomyces alkalinus F11]ROT40846.1 hypothetical protein SODALDRAFT_356871 [Sodiomyces alkalinus F11]
MTDFGLSSQFPQDDDSATLADRLMVKFALFLGPVSRGDEKPRLPKLQVGCRVGLVGLSGGRIARIGRVASTAATCRPENPGTSRAPHPLLPTLLPVVEDEALDPWSNPIGKSTRGTGASYFFLVATFCRRHFWSLVIGSNPCYLSFSGHRPYKHLTEGLTPGSPKWLPTCFSGVSWPIGMWEPPATSVGSLKKIQAATDETGDPNLGNGDHRV